MNDPIRQVVDNRTRRPGAIAPLDRQWTREQELVTQRNTLERLRYKHTRPAALAARTMQRLGDVGRKWFPWMGKGGWV